MIGYEEREKIAWILDVAANNLGTAIKAIDEMGRRDIETIRAEPEAADLICIQGADIIKALRAIARRYER